MIVPIQISMDDLSQFALSPQETEKLIDYTIKEITSAFALQWESVAKQELHSTRKRYIESLVVVDEGRMQGAVVLNYGDPLVRMIEEGASQFDMKTGFERSSKKHMKADGGWYLTIPFSLGTPGSQIESGFSSIMPKQVYQEIKDKPVNDQGQATLMKKEVPAQFAIPKTRAALTATLTSKAFEAYKHKSSIHAGIVKTKDSVTGQSSYNSFRRVSDNSDEDSWVHPGMEAKNLAERSFSKFESTLDIELTRALNNALGQLGII